MPPKRRNVDRRLILGIGHFCGGLNYQIFAQISRKNGPKNNIAEFSIILIKKVNLYKIRKNDKEKTQIFNGLIFSRFL